VKTAYQFRLVITEIDRNATTGSGRDRRGRRHGDLRVTAPRVTRWRSTAAGNVGLWARRTVRDQSRRIETELAAHGLARPSARRVDTFSTPFVHTTYTFRSRSSCPYCVGFLVPRQVSVAL